MSKHVKRESAYAADRRIPGLRLRIKNVSLNKGFHYLFGVVHWMDDLTPPIEMHLERLRDSVLPYWQQTQRQVKSEAGQLCKVLPEAETAK